VAHATNPSLTPYTMTANERLTVLTGDCVAEMAKLEAGFVQLAVTSPPYDSLRSYEGFKFDFKATAYELFRVLCDGGVLCWNVGDSVVNGSETLTSMRQAIHFVDHAGFRMHDTMIYEKSNGSKPNPRRYNQVFEYIFVLSKGVPVTVNLIRDKRNVTAGKSVFGKHTMRQKDGSMTTRKNRLIAAEYGVRGNVWKGNTRGQEDVCESLPHPAMMTKWLARDLILSFSNIGDLVLDPMAGSGTVGKMAIETGRRAIMIDSSAEYTTLIQEQCNVTPGLALA
jgi:DNA modification methylase